MSMPTRHLFLCLLAASLAAGCQEQEPFPLAPPGLGGGDAPLATLSLPDPCAHPAEEDRLIAEMLDAINAERARRKLRPLRLDSTLMLIADFYACRLVDGRFFGHHDPVDGSNVASRATDFGYAFLKVGENLAARQGTVSQAMQELMASARHRENILDPDFTEIGIAVKRGGDHGIYWVQEFGRPITAGAEAPAVGRSVSHEPARATSGPAAATRPAG